MTDPADRTEALIALTADIVAAHVSHHDVAIAVLPDLIRTVHDALAALGTPAVRAMPERTEPAVPIRASIRPDYLVCLEDGKKLKMLKRHLKAQYDLTPDQYRRRWNLPADYPMVAPAYAEQRRALAKQIGLGTRRRTR